MSEHQKLKKEALALTAKAYGSVLLKWQSTAHEVCLLRKSGWVNADGQQMLGAFYGICYCMGPVQKKDRLQEGQTSY